MLQPWSHVFATPGRRLGCFIFLHSFVRLWADPPLLTFAFVAGLFAFIERGAQFQLFALYRKRRAASPSLCFNHAQGGFRGHSPDGGLVRCTWIFSNYLQGRGSACEKADRDYLGGGFLRAIASHCVGLHPVAPSSQENLGRPTIGDVRNRSRIVRTQRTRRTSPVVRVAPKTESRSLVHSKVAAISFIIKLCVTAFTAANISSSRKSDRRIGCTFLYPVVERGYIRTLGVVFLTLEILGEG